MPSKHKTLQQRAAQRGVALLFALIALMTLMLGALALVRHTDTATQLLGNLGFKQDATSAADLAARQAITWLSQNSSALNANIGNGAGYYASSKTFADDGTTATGPIDVTGKQFLDPNRQLINWDNDNCASQVPGSFASCTITPTAAVLINGNSAQYVILRQCNKAGDYSLDSSIKCARPLHAASGGVQGMGELSYTNMKIDPPATSTYYRVLVRVQGFRNTTSVTETVVHF